MSRQHAIRTFFAAIILTVGMTANAHADAKLDAAKAAVAASGGLNTLKQVMPQMLEMQMQALRMNPNVRAEILPIFKEEMIATMPSALNIMIDEVAKLYAKEFSVQELNALTAFFNTPTGQHLAQAQARMAQQIMPIGQVAGQKWAMNALERTQARLAQ